MPPTKTIPEQPTTPGVHAFPEDITALADELHRRTAEFLAQQAPTTGRLDTATAADTLPLSALRGQTLENQIVPDDKANSTFGSYEINHRIHRSEKDARTVGRVIKDFIFGDWAYRGQGKEIKKYNDRVKAIDNDRLEALTKINAKSIRLGRVAALAGRMVGVLLTDKLARKRGLLPEDHSVFVTEEERSRQIGESVRTRTENWRYDLGERRAERNAQRRVELLHRGDRKFYPDMVGQRHITPARYARVSISSAAKLH